MWPSASPMVAGHGRLPPPLCTWPRGSWEPGDSRPSPRKTGSSKSCIRLQGVLGTVEKRCGRCWGHPDPILPCLSPPHVTQVLHFCTAFLTRWSDNPLERNSGAHAGMHVGYHHPWAPWPESQLTLVARGPALRPLRLPPAGRKTRLQKPGHEKVRRVAAAGCSPGMPGMWVTGSSAPWDH